MRYRPLLFAPIAAAALVVSACTANPGNTGEYATDGTFTLTLKTDPGDLNPYLGFGALNDLANLAYDSLLNEADGELVSGLAQEWSGDASSAEFTLQEGITCSDGTELTASDVAAALEFVGNPDNETIIYGLMTPTTPMTITADDSARTVNVTIDEPFSFLLPSLGRVPILCPAALDDPSLISEATLGTGPYVLSEIDPGQSLTFTVREDYAWGPDGATTDVPGIPTTVVARIIDNESTAANLLLSGEINMAAVEGPDRQRLDAQDLASLTRERAGTWVMFNQINRVTADPELRAALIAGLDREQVLAIATEGQGGSATGLIAGKWVCPVGDTVAGLLPEFDVAAAEEMLDEAGWTIGSDGVRTRDGQALQLKVNYRGADAPTKAAAEFVVAQWTELGIQATLTEDSMENMLNAWFTTSDFDVYLGSLGFTIPTQAIPYVSGALPPEGTNILGIDNPGYTEPATEAVATGLPEACDLWKEAEQALWENVDIAPISNLTQRWYLSGAEAAGPIPGTSLPIPTSLRVLE